jgi:hypothetical protein
MCNLHQLISGFLALLIFSPITLADNNVSAASRLNSRELTVSFPHYDPGMQPVDKRVLKCGVLMPKKLGVPPSFQEGKFVEYPLGAQEKQKIIQAGTIPTYFGMYRKINEEGKPVPISQFSKNRGSLFAEGEVFHCSLQHFFLDGTPIVGGATATVKPDATSISWEHGADGSLITVIKY